MNWEHHSLDSKTTCELSLEQQTSPLNASFTSVSRSNVATPNLCMI